MIVALAIMSYFEFGESVCLEVAADFTLKQIHVNLMGLPHVVSCLLPHEKLLLTLDTPVSNTRQVNDVQSNLDISNSDISNSAKLEASI